MFPGEFENNIHDGYDDEVTEQDAMSASGLLIIFVLVIVLIVSAILLICN